MAPNVISPARSAGLAIRKPKERCMHGHLAGRCIKYSDCIERSGAKPPVTKEYCIHEDLEEGAVEFLTCTLAEAMKIATDGAKDSGADFFVMEVVATVKGKRGEDDFDDEGF